MTRDLTPFQLASKLAPVFDGTVVRVEISNIMSASDDGPMDHWVARAWVQPNHRAAIVRELSGPPSPTHFGACANLISFAPGLAEALRIS